MGYLQQHVSWRGSIEACEHILLPNCPSRLLVKIESWDDGRIEDDLVSTLLTHKQPCGYNWFGILAKGDIEAIRYD